MLRRFTNAQLIWLILRLSKKYQKGEVLRRFTKAQLIWLILRFDKHRKEEVLRRFTHAQSVWLILKLLGVGLEEEGRVGESSSVHRFHCRSLYIPSSSSWPASPHHPVASWSTCDSSLWPLLLITRRARVTDLGVSTAPMTCGRVVITTTSARTLFAELVGEHRPAAQTRHYLPLKADPLGISKQSHVGD